MTQQFFRVSWADFYRDTQTLALRLKSVNKWQGIIAVARGGLVPAAIVARELGVRMIDTICAVSYDDEKDTQSDLDVIKTCDLPDGGKGWLVIDDLTDTGVTARTIRDLLPQVHIASVYAKPEGLTQVDDFTTQVSQETWIVFPWEEYEER